MHNWTQCKIGLHHVASKALRDVVMCSGEGIRLNEHTSLHPYPLLFSCNLLPTCFLVLYSASMCLESGWAGINREGLRLEEGVFWTSAPFELTLISKPEMENLWFSRCCCTSEFHLPLSMMARTDWWLSKTTTERPQFLEPVLNPAIPLAAISSLAGEDTEPSKKQGF